ncbi:MAG: penicillin acylase family protein [Kofleriaceae bacterium]
MRSIFACLVTLVTAAGCAHPDNPGPELTITPSDPSGTVAITGPTNFSAVISNTTAEETVTWTVSGGGTISSTTGLHTVFQPALGLMPAAATLTAATADGLTATVSISSGPAVITSDTIPNLLAPVTVLTDAQDIPHIRCATKIDCLAVQGYIHARDRFFMMDFLRHVARANLAELIGVDGVSQDVQIRTLFVTRSGQRIEDALSANSDPAIKALLDAYTGGVNAYLAYLRAHPSDMPGEYKQLPFPITAADIGQWSDEDTFAMARLQQFQLSETLSEETGFATFAQAFGPTTARFRAWIRSAAPAGEQAHTLSATAHTGVVARSAGAPATNLAALGDGLAKLDAKLVALRDRLRPYDASVGSNNWVISSAMSATHQAMVANDPHLSLQYPPLFHLAVMTSALAADHLDLAGGAFPGIPGALVGRGQHVGWGVTVVGYDVTDVYQEVLSACAPAGCVSYNGVPEPLIVVPQTFLVRTAAGLVNANTIQGVSVPAAVLIAPHHGPIIQLISPGVALSVRWTGQEGNTQDLRGILGLNTATDVDSAIASLKDFATGAQNFVLADDQGHIAYDPHALVPVRNFADPLQTAGNPQAPWFPLKGYDGSAEWGPTGTDCASAGATAVPATCWIADNLLPQGKDPAKGYFMTANADPTANGVTDGNSPLSPANQPYLSFDWDDSTGFRATRIQERIEAAIATNGSVSEADMESIQSDHVSRPGKFFATYIAGLPTASDTANLTAAKAILATWSADGWDCPSGLTGSDPNNSGIDTSGTVVDDSAGCFLFHAFLRDLFTNVFTDDLKVVGQGVNQLQAMKAMMYMLTPDGAGDQDFCGTANGAGAVTPKTCASQVVTALAQAYAQVAGSYGSVSSQWKWGKVHTMQPVPLLALITTNYEPGPYARPGGAFTVDVGTPSTASAGLKFPFGSSGNVRHISVMNPTTPVTKMQLPGPEKDGPVLFGGPDLLGQWVLNKYFDFAIGTQVDAVTVSTQTFTAH